MQKNYAGRFPEMLAEAEPSRSHDRRPQSIAVVATRSSSRPDSPIRLVIHPVIGS
jgi:hypothetical protein